MTLRLRHLRLRVVTPLGRFGADIPLASGLVILRADNSRGKSTAVQSILFALGLERMITAQPTNAVTSAMRDRIIFDPVTKAETVVLSSWVSLEMENAAGSVVTATRWVKHDTIDTGLVRIAAGPELTGTSDYESENYYTGRSGALANPRGYQRWLAEFVGWTLPEFPTADGRSATLYMEQVFPLLFVEQRRGWGGIQAQMPYFAGVSEVRRRAIEFLLDMDVGRFESRLQELKAQQAQLQVEWRQAVETFKATLAGEGLFPVRLPDSLTVAWPPAQPPHIAHSDGGAWIDVDKLLSNLRLELLALESDEIPRVSAVASEMESALSHATQEADRLRQTGALYQEELFRDRNELDSVRRRLSALKDDLREHQDVVTLLRLGASEVDRLHGDCPVCHRVLPESLLTDSSVRTLSPDDTVAFIKQQIELFDVMESDGDRSLRSKYELLAGHQRAEASIRSEIRSLRTALLGSNSAPSTDAIARRVRIGDRIDRLGSVIETFYELLGRLERMASDARSIRGAIESLPKERLSETDARKLAALETSFIDQLRAYDFGSFSDERLMVSRDDYLPRREEFDLQADISASDSIRVIWAYLLGLLETSREFSTNHPRILVFDEPRQQSAKEVSFAALLRRAAGAGSDGQVLFATSEGLESLSQMLRDVPHSLHAIEGFVLQRVDG